MPDRDQSQEPKSAEDLLPAVYLDLRKLAAARLAQERPGQTLQNNVRQIAIYQRRLVLAIGGALLAEILLLFPGLERIVHSMSIVLDIVALLALAGFGVMIVLLVLRLVKALGHGVVLQAIVAVVMFVPWVGLATLLFVNWRTTKVLQSHGLEVGLFGVSDAQLERVLHPLPVAGTGSEPAVEKSLQ